MLRRFTDLKYAIILAAGIVGLVFDRLEGQEIDFEEALGPDDLTVISGLGPASARRLNEAGVSTFAQLAELSPDRALEITSYTQGDFAQWIADAKELA
jgi:predicted flap endonuclease-1-like 5' DNA nuclease